MWCVVLAFGNAHLFAVVEYSGSISVLFPHKSKDYLNESVWTQMLSNSKRLKIKSGLWKAKIVELFKIADKISLLNT